MPRTLSLSLSLSLSPSLSFSLSLFLSFSGPFCATYYLSASISHATKDALVLHSAPICRSEAICFAERRQWGPGPRTGPRTLSTGAVRLSRSRPLDISDNSRRGGTAAGYRVTAGRSSLRGGVDCIQHGYLIVLGPSYLRRARTRYLLSPPRSRSAFDVR